jgi:bacteriorhodopsin
MDSIVVRPPWTAVLTDGEHTLVLFAVVTAALALLATLVRVRFSSGEVHGEYRTASLTANSVVAIAFGSYVLVLAALLAGYGPTATGWVPNEFASFAWSFRYADWAITVPLLVVELLAVSIVFSKRRSWIRSTGMGLAFVMILLGFLGAFVVGDGRNFRALVVLGVASALCFVALTVLILRVALRTLPRLPPEARSSYRGAIALLLVTWFVYPIVYGLQGTTSGGGWAVTGVVALCAADIIAKVGFGSLIHRAGVLRSRADEEASPTTERRPRQPEADMLWVEDQGAYQRDPDLFRDRA